MCTQECLEEVHRGGMNQQESQHYPVLSTCPVPGGLHIILCEIPPSCLGGMMTLSCRLLSVSRFLLLRERMMITTDPLLCSGVGLARVIRVDRTNISCCCLEKCLLGPGEKLWFPPRAHGTGWAPPPAPQVRGSGLQEAPGHLTLGRLGTRLFRLAG